MIKRWIKETLKKISAPAFKKELNSLDSIATAYQQLQEKNKPGWINPGNTCAGIVFSKDRAMQLHALLASYFSYVKNPLPLYILYTFSNERHAKSYEELKSIFGNKEVVFIKESVFKPDLEKLLESIDTDNLFFMTDDGLFIDSFDMKDVTAFNPVRIIPSLIKGMDLTYCYIQDRKQQLPQFITIPKSDIPTYLKCWEWSRAESFSDWAYPLSLDVTFYNKKEIQTLIVNISYKGPNSLETALHDHYSPIFLQRKGVCFEKAKYVNIVCNVVNTEHNNRNTGLHSIDDLLRKWEEGYRIQYEDFFGKQCADAEQSSFNFINR
jgi:hypothetical protein